MRGHITSLLQIRGEKGIRRLCREGLGATIVRLDMRPASTRTLFLLLTLALLAPPPASSQQSSSAYGPLPVFEFHSGFWINLHHMLYYEAKLRETPPPTAQKSPTASTPQIRLKTMNEAAASLTPAERAAWDNSVAYYATNYANKDLLFNNDL